MDKLTSMNVFVRVAKAGSFAGGARDLGISRAMATKHIITHLQTEPRGLLKISAPPAIGATHIARAVAEFLKIHTDLTIEMILQGSPGDLIDEGIDVAIFLGALDDSSMVARKLASSSLVVCGAPGYLELNGTPKVPEDLANHSCLVNWAISPRNKWQFKSDTGPKTVNVTGRMQANAAHPIRIAAINGLGLVMLPTYIVGKDIENGTLKVVLENYPLPPLDIHAVYPHRKYLSAKVKSFIKQDLDPLYQGQYEIQVVPNIVHIGWGRGVGYTSGEETFDETVTDISATKIRKELGLK